MILYVVILTPIVMAITLYLIPLPFYKLLLALAQSVIFAMATYLFIQIDITHTNDLIHSLGGYSSWMSINLVADPISALLILLTSLLFLMCTLYAYDKSVLNKQFLLLFLILQGLINGIFLVQDLFSLYALIEVSTIVVSILIMYKKDSRSIYDGIVYLLINVISMTFFLIGIGFIYKIFGTLNLLLLKDLVMQYQYPQQLILPYVFIITALSTKFAVIPLFSWLPRAHVTPSAPYIVSAILSALYIKGNLYIFIRIQEIFSHPLDVHEVYLYLGFFTAIIGALLALAQKNIKLLLAYSTYSQIGFIIFALSLSNDISYYGSIYHIISHALFKTTLFLCVGILVDCYETSELTKINSVMKNLPHIGIIMIIAMLSITGAPLFNGSISKYLITKASNLDIAEYGLMMMNITTIMYMIHLGKIFKGPKTKNFQIFYAQKLILIFLALLCLMGGVFGQNFIKLFFDVSIDWGISDYIEKGVTYSISLIVAFLMYNLVYRKSKFLQSLHKIELTFNELVFAMVIFFTSFLGYMMIVF